ncbi:MAG: hypothetical protein COX02_02560 [Candidatus Vogelbacteria bacterium CG22_combo_CG10-13_8_21_14_all_37_9]|uniref:LysM domain-containing protein n=1 Tax=Candidatus Vogelbacteria bacterium CG22_combo_CG10-13_8_21_14_all_37_9 TaxID=1975046 RepID=A0A2H0BLW8_9BACT|nr:MAG: hypothetical protein BK005_01620 [bacterium CG10_37_50]PIP58010.1 MAG: hypothetical protein COX02_02560 [Candidatus Vogelbacteria bacterium CG22_combo_CG10-13_8_21_14_all_37_9]
MARGVEASIFSKLSAWLVGESLANNDLPIAINSQTMPLLEAAANFDPRPSKESDSSALVGGTAILSEAGPMGTVADIKDYQGKDRIAVYVVRPGDSLKAIAKMFSVESNTILWANDLSNKYVPKEGDVLVILPVDGLIHTVLKGETVKGLANKYHGNAEEIIAYNDLNTDGTLLVGDRIVIPGGQIASPSAGKAPVTNSYLSRYTGPDYSGYFLRPIVGGRKTQGLHGRNGVDLAAPSGTAVYASASGKVILARADGWNGGYGEYIVIQHPNGTETLYSHLSKVSVSRGEKVERGQRIGSVGSTGRSTGPHLHLEIHGATNPF